MARTVSVQFGLIPQIQLMCQDPDLILADQLTYVEFINRNYARLFAMYVEAEPDRYRSESPLQMGSDPYPFDSPAEWYSTIGVDHVEPGNRRVPLMRLQEQDRNRFFNQTGPARAFRMGFQDKLELFPTPNNGEQYVLIWLPTAPVLQVTDSVDLRIGHEKYLEMTTARDLLNAENTYDGRWDDEILKIEAELRYEANSRYFHDMARMTSEYGLRHRYWPFGYPYGVRW